MNNNDNEMGCLLTIARAFINKKIISFYPIAGASLLAGIELERSLALGFLSVAFYNVWRIYKRIRQERERQEEQKRYAKTRIRREKYILEEQEKNESEVEKLLNEKGIHSTRTPRHLRTGHINDEYLVG